MKAKTLEEKAADACEELRTSIRGAHEAAQEVRAAIKEGRAQVEGYLGTAIQTALNEYQAALQAELTRQIDSLEEKMLAWARKLTGQLQAVANGHTEVYFILAQSLHLGIEPPGPEFSDSYEERRLAIIAAGRRMVDIYAKAGLESANEKTNPEVVRAMTNLQRRGEYPDPESIVSKYLLR